MKPMLTVAVIFLFATTSLVSAQVIRGNPKVGQGVYEQQCLRCHGSKLDGNGPDSRDLIVRPADLRSRIGSCSWPSRMACCSARCTAFAAN
jgi:cytochrome c oxidase cbb3-type subunit 3